jgi:catechol 2,3-dioxygenase-like lactoylglutathione lyase family enzyme
LAITHTFAGVPISDYDAAAAWYERLFGRPPDMLPNDHEAVWQLSEAGWVYIVADRERAGRALVTLLVDDLDEQRAGLDARGLAPEPIDTVPGVVRTAAVTDPDGNRITFGEPAAS